MIKQLTVRNYRSHKDTVLDFHPGVDVIAGRSQSGKTNLLRALLKLSKNRPRGFKFRPNFTDDPTRLSLVLDGSVIELESDGKEIQYRFDGQTFEKMGTDVPDLIEKNLNLSDLNIQEQLDTPFLITSPPGEVARTINRVTKLEQVDEWISELTTDVNRANREIDGLQSDVVGLEDSLEKYKDLDVTRKIIEELTEVDKEMAAYERDSSLLSSSIDRMEQIEIELGDLKSFLGAERYVARAEKVDKELKELLGQLELLEDAIRLDEKAVHLEETYEILGELNGFVKQEKFCAELKRAVDEIEDIEMDIETLEKEKEKYEGGYIELLRELGKCPVCFSDITGETLERAKEML